MNSPYNVNRLALWLHRHYFATSHFWVTMKPGTEFVPGTWCFECGTIKNHVYSCDSENRFRQQCEPFGDYPNCVEILEALLFVHHPDVDKATLCPWCLAQVKANLSPILYIEPADPDDKGLCP